MVERTTGSRGMRKRSGRFLAPEQVPRFHCDFCKRDISRKIRIKCADCADFDLCVECFAVGVEYQEHKKTHRYRVIDDMSFAVFSSSWGADEELLFFDGICDFGISNWEAVAHVVGSKSAEACKQHYLELMDKQQWLEQEAPEPDPPTAKDVNRSAFPTGVDSDVFAASPKTLSPTSSLDWSVSSLSEGERELPEEQEWILLGSGETSKSSPGAAASDLEGTLIDMDVEPSTEEGKDETPSLNPKGPTSSRDGTEGGAEIEGSEDESGMEEEAKNEEPVEMTLPSKRQKQDVGQTPFTRPSLLTTPGTTPGRSLSSFDTNAGEVTGYNPFRGEFDPPYDVGAEQMIADLEFLDDDPEEVTKAKLKLLHLYRWRIHERGRRTELLKKNRFGLMDVRKIMAGERSWNANEKFADLRPFARFSGLDKIERLAKGMCFERTLRRRLQELQEARSVGCRTFAEIRSRSKDVKGPRPAERTTAQLIGKWRRFHPELSGGSIRASTLPDLTPREQAFCVEVGFSPWQFAVLRDRLIREAEENDGRFSKFVVRAFFRLDTAQALKLFDFFNAEGAIVNSDKEPARDAKKSLQPDEAAPAAPAHDKATADK